MIQEEKALHLLRILLRSSSSVMQMLKKNMESLGLNATEFMTLELLYHKGPQLAQAISKEVLMASSSITYVVDCLVKKSYVKREICAEDRRKTYISLTDEGRQLMDDIFPKHAAEIKNLFDLLTEEDYNRLADNLKAIGLRAQQMHGE